MELGKEIAKEIVGDVFCCNDCECSWTCVGILIIMANLGFLMYVFFKTVDPPTYLDMPKIAPFFLNN